VALSQLVRGDVVALVSHLAKLLVDAGLVIFKPTAATERVQPAADDDDEATVLAAAAAAADDGDELDNTEKSAKACARYKRRQKERDTAEQALLQCVRVCAVAEQRLIAAAVSGNLTDNKQLAVAWSEAATAVAAASARWVNAAWTCKAGLRSMADVTDVETATAAVQEAKRVKAKVDAERGTLLVSISIFFFSFLIQLQIARNVVAHLFRLPFVLLSRNCHSNDRSDQRLKSVPLNKPLDVRRSS